MEPLTSVMLRGFQLMCLAIFLVLVGFQVRSYIENKDSSTVSYRQFNHEERDLYPTVSLCLQSREGRIFNKGSNSQPYAMGQDWGKLYQEMLLGNVNASMEYENISYRNATWDLFDDFVEVFFIMTKQGDVIDAWQPNVESHPFFKSYEDPYMTCMTKKVKYVHDQLLNLGSLVIKASAFYTSKIENLLVYMHHPGQLTRQFGKQILHLTQASFQKAMNRSNNYYSIHINQVEVLRKRSDGVIPCNDSLLNEDMVWRENVMRKVGCIPEYWSDLHSDFSIDTIEKEGRSSKCNSSEQLRQISKYYLPPKHTGNGASLYTGPCIQLGITASVIQSDLQEENLVLGFNYVVEEYSETINSRAFGFESLWSQIGGFVGMFLGCGLLQVPDIIDKFVQWLKKLTAHNAKNGSGIENETAFITLEEKQSMRNEISNKTDMSNTTKILGETVSEFVEDRTDESNIDHAHTSMIIPGRYKKDMYDKEKINGKLLSIKDFDEKKIQADKPDIDSVIQLKKELENLHQRLNNEKDLANEWRANCELMQQTHNQNLLATEKLLRRVSSLEKSSTKTIEYIEEC